jgi:hypothetical protein
MYNTGAYVFLKIFNRNKVVIKSPDKERDMKTHYNHYKSQGLVTQTGYIHMSSDFESIEKVLKKSLRKKLLV